MLPPNEKTCSKCKVIKPIYEFFKQRQVYGIGYRPRCKACTKVDRKFLKKTEVRWEDIDDGREWV